MEKIYFVSLGCDKNLVDSEQMMALLSEKGYVFTDDISEAGCAVINTCCFIGDAKEESINTIIEVGSYKEKGSLKALVICGCLAQRYSEEIRSELPEVDAIVGTTAFDEIDRAIKEALEGKGADHLKDRDSYTYLEGRRSLSTGGHYAYLKIAEGCDKSCTYCIIPKVRGRYRSVPMDVLEKEARQLAEDGVSELILVAQEITVYGMDLEGRKLLPALLERLCAIEGIKWIRLLYCYPEEITDELIDVIKREPKICHYIDMPVQSGSDNVLKRMGRRCTSADIEAVVGKLREAVPDICIRTTFITGFPGESEEDHRASAEMIKKLRFDRLGVFTYSPEEGTPAFGMEPMIDEEVKLKRLDELMLLQQQVVFEKNAGLEGSLMDAFIEGRDVENDVYVARTYRDAPEVDGLIFIKSDREIMSGTIVRARVTGSGGYDLTGEIEEED